MISSRCFTKDWIDHLREIYPKTDPILLEKTIYAFELLGLLVQSEQSFIFKGGTALLLHIPDANRLSIDVDIVGKFEIDALKKFIKGSQFIDINEDFRESKGIPKKHFAFTYSSLFQQANSNILLDVLEVNNPYSHIIMKPINHHLFEIEESLSVSLPTIEGLLGDKLTAFAPETIGVSYGINKSMEILKQLYDIGILFDKASDIKTLRSNYQSVYFIENQFRDSKFNHDNVLEDTIDTSYLLCQLDLRSAIENKKTQELRNGILQLKSHLLNTSFNFPEAKVAASKAAFLAASVKAANKINPFQLLYNQDKIDELHEANISGRFSILNRLKGSLPEAFYYWHLISNLENERE